MTNKQKTLAELQQHTEELTRLQWAMSKELIAVQTAIKVLSEAEATEQITIQPTPLIVPPESIVQTVAPVVETVVAAPKETVATSTVVEAIEAPTTVKIEEAQAPPTIETTTVVEERNLEKFIGENLANKIGIIITVLGVSIGAKYAIDHDYISPALRIVLGYVMGIGLYGVSARLRAQYEDFSAVLVSGAFAILFFITYAAYDFYHLFPQILTFLLLVGVTVGGVFTAMSYNRQWIAIGGLVGAYSIPFLLSTGEDHAGVLFSYMTIINIGILTLAFLRDWRMLFNISFVTTWIIFLKWSIFSGGYLKEAHFGMALFFLTVFFVLFYAMLMAYKFIRDEAFHAVQGLFLILNSFIFYAIGYSLLGNHPIGMHCLGIFTLLNAIAHFWVSTTVFQRDLTDKSLFLLVSGLTIIFVTMTFPVQFDGHWVTTFWAGEMALLFWIGRTRSLAIYERYAYPLFFLSLVSLAIDCLKGYNSYYGHGESLHIFPIFNVYFLTTVLVGVAFGFIYKINNDEKYNLPTPLERSQPDSERRKNWSNFFLIVLIGLTYCLFFNEIDCYFDQNYTDSYRQGNWVRHNENILRLKEAWLFIYTLFFVAGLSLFFRRKLPNVTMGMLASPLILLTLIVFLIMGLYNLGDLKNAYLYQFQRDTFMVGWFNVAIRYVAYLAVTGILYALYENQRRELKSPLDVPLIFDFILHGTTLWILSSELVHWLELSYSTEGYKLAFSLLWGAYSLLLIVCGIRGNKRYLRLSAIAIFTFTLLKLFIYDLAHLETIAKTIVLVALGLLLLVISFLYNKFKPTEEK